MGSTDLSLKYSCIWRVTSRVTSLLKAFKCILLNLYLWLLYAWCGGKGAQILAQKFTGRICNNSNFREGYMTTSNSEQDIQQLHNLFLSLSLVSYLFDFLFFFFFSLYFSHSHRLIHWHISLADSSAFFRSLFRKIILVV